MRLRLCIVATTCSFLASILIFVPAFIFLHHHTYTYGINYLWGCKSGDDTHVTISADTSSSSSMTSTSNSSSSGMETLHIDNTSNNNALPQPSADDIATLDWD